MTNLPPGSSGLPLLGETLSFVKDIFGFIHRRTQQHGPIFRSHILGTPTVFISGPEVCDAWLDESKIQREGAFPAPVQELFGGPGILPLLDGAAHRARKQIVLSGFSREAIAAYLPALQTLIENSLKRWAALGEVKLLEELKMLAIECICGNVLGLPAGDPTTAALVADYQFVFQAFAALPIKLPGTPFTKGLRARDRILTRYREQVARHQQAQSDDGLSRILAARAPDGTQITAEQAALELHHVVLAGYIVFAELAALLIELNRHPQIRERLAAEVKAQSAAGSITPAQLRQMPYLLQVINETKRATPVVPVSFGRTRADLSLNGFTIPAGWNVMMAVVESNFNQVFTEPAKFDPERFSPARAEEKRHPHAFAPQGAGTLEGHKCAGYDYSTVLMQVFAVALLRRYAWELPAQDLSLKYALIPPEQKSGLRVQLKMLQ